MVWPNPEHIQKNLRTVSLCFIMMSLSGSLYAVSTDTRLPFRISNNLMILEASINGSDTLHFILDSGLKTSIICELGEEEAVQLEEVRNIQVKGLGTSSPAEAFFSSGNSIKLGGVKIKDCNFVVLSTNTLGLSNKMGTKIHGMLSMNLFSDYLVEINYEKNYISLLDPNSFPEEKLKRFTSLPLVLESGKPFIQIRIIEDGGRSIPVKLLLDSGASIALWLDVNSRDDLSIPENSVRCYLGCGISGDVEGLISRIDRIEIGSYKLSDVLVSFPDSAAIVRQESIHGRNGSLGADILKRFDIILDLSGEKIYLRPNRNFPQKFHHDMSGIEVLSRTPEQPDYLISRVQKDSPAFLAGISAGDHILSINNRPAEELTMDNIYQILTGPSGKKVRLQILRNGEKLKLSFTLKKII